MDISTVYTIRVVSPNGNSRYFDSTDKDGVYVYSDGNYFFKLKINKNGIFDIWAYYSPESDSALHEVIHTKANSNRCFMYKVIESVFKSIFFVPSQDWNVYFD